MKKYGTIKLLIILVSMSFVLSGCMYFFPVERSEYVPDLQSSEKLVIPTVPVRQGSVRLSYELGGDFRADPVQTSVVESEITGTVENIYAVRGQQVTQGQLVATIDDRNINDQLFYAEINLQRATLQYQSVRNRFNTGQADRYDLELAELTLQRFENQLNDLKERKEKHRIYAPVSGTVVSVSKGPGSSALGEYMSICEKEDGVAHIFINIPNDNYVFTPEEQAISMLRPGAQVRVEFKGVEYPAELKRDNFDYVSEVTGVATGNVDMQFQFLEMPEQIAFNSPISVHYVEDEAIDVMIIPRACVFTEGDAYYTYVVENGNINKTYIEVGINDGAFYEVISGVELGDLILLNP